MQWSQPKRSNTPPSHGKRRPRGGVASLTLLGRLWRCRHRFARAKLEIHSSQQLKQTPVVQSGRTMIETPFQFRNFSTHFFRDPKRMLNENFLHWHGRILLSYRPLSVSGRNFANSYQNVNSFGTGPFTCQTSLYSSLFPCGLSIESTSIPTPSPVILRISLSTLLSSL